MDVVVGVDGGGSRTRVSVADRAGNELAVAEGAGSALTPEGADRSAAVITAIVSEALVSLTGARVLALCAGVAGAGREAEREALEESLESRGLAMQVIVVPDAVLALEDAFGSGPGIVLLAGTGSIALGRGPTGAMARCGGWGPAFGDEGSAAWIGRKALATVAAAYDGREPETDLVAPLLAATKCSTAEDLVAWARAATPADLARLAPLVAEGAATGDLRAESLLALAVEELALHVRTLARRLFGDERASFPLALGGGLLARGSLVRRRLEQRLRSMTPGAQLRDDDLVPVRGAVRMALRELQPVLVPR